jgi:murein DD-endopeptidase
VLWLQNASRRIFLSNPQDILEAIEECRQDPSMNSFARLVPIFVLVLLAWPAGSATRESFDITVPAPPGPVTIDGRSWLIYELHLTNFSRQPLRISKVDVLSGNDVLHSFAGAALDQRLALAAVAREETQSVRAGERAIVYLEVEVSAKRLPSALRHRVRFQAEDHSMAEVVSAQNPVKGDKPAPLGPPLRGGPWSAVYAWEWPRGHRRVFYAVDGRARLPGRFAIDWVRRDAEGRAAHGDADVVKNSLGHGADVLAVADSRVAQVRDGIAETERVSANPKHSLDEAAGNYVALDLGDGRFALYEHLAPGSIRVAPGERVRRGQVIASLGFTGDSTEPHLHFHVADSPSPLAGEGLPFELERFRVEGSGTPVVRHRERPAPNARVTFD